MRHVHVTIGGRSRWHYSGTSVFFVLFVVGAAMVYWRQAILIAAALTVLALGIHYWPRPKPTPTTEDTLYTEHPRKQ